MDDNGTRQYLTFCLGGERFALESLVVSEVMDMPAMTRVPLGPPYLQGIVNLRGNAATVVDLARLLDLERQGDLRDACLIILERDYDGDRALLAAVAESVQKVVEIPHENVTEPPEMGLAVDPRFVLGLATLDGESLMVLDPDRIFSLEELTAHEPVPKNASGGQEGNHSPPGLS